jgi:hypothetical protein
MSEVRSFLERHLQSIFESDSRTYHETTDENLRPKLAGMTPPG